MNRTQGDKVFTTKRPALPPAIAAFLFLCLYSFPALCSSPDDILTKLDGASLKQARPILANLGKIEKKFFESMGDDARLNADKFELEKSRFRSVVIKEKRSFSENELYLFFYPRKSGKKTVWKYVGSLYAERMNVKRVIPWGKNRLFLVMSGSSFSGTGANCDSETWYLVDAKSVDCALDYYANGYVEGWGMLFNREFSSEVIEEMEVNGRFRLDLKFDVEYKNSQPKKYDNLEGLFSYTRTARFYFNEKSRSFEIVKSKSSIDPFEIEQLFGEDSDGFLTSNYKYLLQMAKSKETVKSKWLSDFLSGCEDTAEKKKLLKVLKK